MRLRGGPVELADDRRPTLSGVNTATLLTGQEGQLGQHVIEVIAQIGVLCISPQKGSIQDFESIENDPTTSECIDRQHMHIDEVQ